METLNYADKFLHRRRRASRQHSQQEILMMMNIKKGMRDTSELGSEGTDGQVRCPPRRHPPARRLLHTSPRQQFAYVCVIGVINPFSHDVHVPISQEQGSV